MGQDGTGSGAPKKSKVKCCWCVSIVDGLFNVLTLKYALMSPTDWKVDTCPSHCRQKIFWWGCIVQKTAMRTAFPFTLMQPSPNFVNWDTQFYWKWARFAAISRDSSHYSPAIQPIYPIWVGYWKPGRQNHRMLVHSVLGACIKQNLCEINQTAVFSPRRQYANATQDICVLCSVSLDGESVINSQKKCNDNTKERLLDSIPGEFCFFT